MFCFMGLLGQGGGGGGGWVARFERSLGGGYVRENGWMGRIIEMVEDGRGCAACDQCSIA